MHVYAEDGPELADYLQKIESYNARRDNPTAWRMQSSTPAPISWSASCRTSAGDVVVIAGNNRRKSRVHHARGRSRHARARRQADGDRRPRASTRWCARSPTRATRGVLLYDIMTERHEITTMLQKAFSRIPAVFGELLHGSLAEPAIVKESVHHFSKLVSGTPVKRPAWFFDVEQQGEGLVDITTHLVDLVQWECFPGESLDFSRDVAVLAAKRWPTGITLGAVRAPDAVADVSGLPAQGRRADGNLHVYANGEIDYRIKGVHAKVRVLWNFEAPPGAGDTHYSVMRGSKANLVIRQGAAEGWQPTLYIEPGDEQRSPRSCQSLLAARDARTCARRTPASTWSAPGASGASSSRSRTTSATKRTSGRSHRRSCATSPTARCRRGRFPNMIAKYHTTTRALAVAHGSDPGSGPAS